MRYLFTLFIASVLLVLFAGSRTAPQEYDLILRNGTIYDGSGTAPYVGDVAISGDRIAAVGELPEAVAKKEIDVKVLLNEALQILRSAVDATDATVTVETEVDTVTGDPVQLLQLIQNLISNALKFTNSDEPHVMIRCYEEDGHIRFAVADNGIGISKTDQQKVFEIFRRLHTKKEYPGTGIGLAICKKIVDRHKGRIWPESEPGKGTTFYFTLNEEANQRLEAS